MKVSVIIPIYNVEKYVKECLDSVRNQTLQDLEMICVDDAGEDGSWEIVKAVAAEDNRIKLIENERNLGLSASRNRGMDHASGEYLYFLDSDDKIEEHTLETLYTRAEKEQLEVEIFESSFIFENEDLKKKFQSNPFRFKNSYPDIMNGRTLYIKWMEAWDWMPVQMRYFYKTSFLKEHQIRFVEGMLHEDEIFAFDVLMCAERIRVLKNPFFIRRFREASIMTKKSDMRNVKGCIKILKHVFAAKENFSDDLELERAVRFYMKKIAENARKKYEEACSEIGASYRPKVSVVIPVYNVERYLEACLKSVLLQTLDEIEILCADDASTDYSLQILKEYESLDPRVRIFINEKNKGPSAARNLAASHATGEYLYMLDADDLIISEALEELYQMCCEENLDVIGFENKQFTNDSDFDSEAENMLFTYRDSEGLYNGKSAFIHCVTKDVISPSVPTFMLKRSYIEKIDLKFFEGILHEDIGYILEMLLSAERIRLVSKAYFLRRFRAHSTMTSAFTARNIEGYLKSFLKSFELEEKYKKKYGDDVEFWDAYKKWQRDILGRIRQLYLCYEKDIYHEEGGNVDEEIRRIFEILKLVTTGRARSEDILGKQICEHLEKGSGKKELQEIYICGCGQYANRMLDVAGALELVIKGVISREKKKRTMRGFRVYQIEEIEDKEKPVIMAVSRYQKEEYETDLKRYGFLNIVDVTF